MLFKTLLILLVAACRAQNDPDMNALIKQIFGNPPTTSVPVPQERSCTTDDGKPGVCVMYFQCHSSNNTLNTDGIGLIDLRSVQPFRTNFIRKNKTFTDRKLDLSYQTKYRFQNIKCGSSEVCCLAGNTSPSTDPPPIIDTRRGCGWRNPNGAGMRTTGETGGETKYAEFPWMCAILKIEPVEAQDPDSLRLFIYLGGGSLIHPSVVLTAAHNVAKRPTLRVRAGEWDTQTTREPYPYQDRKVSSIEVHQAFNGANLHNDVAVLFLAQPMDLAPNVQLACLPPPKEVAFHGTRCFATGWGKDKFEKKGRFQVILKKVELPVVAHGTCQALLRKTRLGRFFQLHSSFMCAGGQAGVDMCKGDGGSPLSCPIQNDPGRYVQSGIVAWGLGCGEQNIPGAYVDVAYLRDWIDEKVAAMGYDTSVYQAQ